MKRIIPCTVILCFTFFGTLTAQQSDFSDAEAVPEVPTAIVDADNPGMGLLDQATEAKLRANTAKDLGQVIVLCRRAKRAGLSGDNLKYCNELLASSQLQRGLFFAQTLEQPDDLAGNWQELRQQALADLEEAVTVIKDQPMAYMRIAGLNLLPGGNRDRAKEVLNLVIQNVNDSPVIQVEAAKMLAALEPDAEKREMIWAAAAKNGHPQTMLFHALTLFELKRNAEAVNILLKLIEAESGNAELQERIATLLINVREYKTAMSILDTLREKSTNDEGLHQIDMRRAETLVHMGQFDEALDLLNTLYRKYRENRALTVETLGFRANVHFVRDDLQEALKDIEAAEEILPDSLPVLELKYKILREMKNYNDALAVVKKMQTIDDRLQYALMEIVILNELEKYDDSVEIVQQLRTKYPEENAANWTMLLVEIYSQQKAYDKALALVDEQLKENPEEIRWIVAKAQVLTTQQKWDEAVNWIESHIQKNSDPQRLTRLLIGVLYEQKKYGAAKEQMKPLLEKNPDDLDLIRIDSQLSISLGLHSEAIEALTKVVEAEPDDYTSVNNLAWILCTSPVDSLRNGRRAVELAEQAGKLTNYKKAFILSTLAAAYAETGDFDKAREISLKSIEAAKTEKSKTEEERKELLEHLQKERNCFEQNMPFRELLEDGEQ